MDTNQVIKAIGEAAANTKPAQEYCFLWLDHWSTCMTKSEWSGWMQAIFSVMAIIFASMAPFWQEARSERKSLKITSLRLKESRIAFLNAYDRLVNLRDNVKKCERVEKLKGHLETYNKNIQNLLLPDVHEAIEFKRADLEGGLGILLAQSLNEYKKLNDEINVMFDQNINPVAYAVNRVSFDFNFENNYARVVRDVIKSIGELDSYIEDRVFKSRFFNKMALLLWKARIFRLGSR